MPLEYHKVGGGALSVGEDTHSVYRFVYKFERKLAKFFNTLEKMSIYGGPASLHGLTRLFPFHFRIPYSVSCIYI